MEIKDYARKFINNPRERTPERQSQIVKEYLKLTGRRINITCGTCYIEAILTIIRHMENTSKYKLKKGCIIQPFGGGIITNDNLTDEIAEQALRDRTANPLMFAEMPYDPEDLKIVPVEIEVKKRGRKAKINESISNGNESQD